jgi:hypothetical protein
MTRKKQETNFYDPAIVPIERRYVFIGSVWIVYKFHIRLFSIAGASGIPMSHLNAGVWIDLM